MAQIPQRYDEDRVRLILRDPTWALAIWEVRKSIEDSWAGEASFRGLILKVTERVKAETSPVSSFILPVTQAVGTRYLHLPHPGRFYQVELLGQFDRETRPLSHSGIVEAPSEGPPYEALLESDPQKRRFLELSGLKLCEPYQESTEQPEASSIPQRVGGWDESIFEESR